MTGDPGALGGDGRLGNLHHDLLALADHLLDAVALVRTGFPCVRGIPVTSSGKLLLDLGIALLEHVVHVDKRGLTQPHIHECGLHPGKNTLDPAFVDVSGDVRIISPLDK